MSIHFSLPISQKILAKVSRLDHFQGLWASQRSIPEIRLRRIEEAVRILSTGASCRLAGIPVTDAEAAGLVRGESLAPPDAREILGYARAWSSDMAPDGELIDTRRISELHAEMLGAERSTVASEWRTQRLHREAFVDGRATGRVFPTLPHRLVPEKTEELLAWLEIELRSREQHPVLVIGTFVLCFFSISPYEKANGRMARLLANHLLRRAGYGAIPYASLERCIEELRVEHDGAVLQSQTGLWTDQADLEPWLNFFLKVLERHRARVEAKLALEREVEDYPPLQRVILETVREHGNVGAALLLKATGANRNTLKDNLRRLVQRGVLEKTGLRRGTRYRMSSGEIPTPRPSAPQS